MNIKYPFVAPWLILLGLMAFQSQSTAEALSAEPALAAIKTYGLAWNEPNAARRAELVASSWVIDGRYIDPHNALTGRDKILPLIDQFRSRYPGAEVIATSRIDFHHNRFRASWKIVLADGSELLVGEDFGITNAEGQIVELSSFFNKLMLVEQ